MSEDTQLVFSDDAIVDEFVNFFSMFSNEEGDYYTSKINALNAENKTLVVKSDHLFNTHQFEQSDFMKYFINNKKVEFYLQQMNEAVQRIYCSFHPEVEKDETFPLTDLNAKLSVDDDFLVTKMKHMNINLRNRLVVFDAIIVSKSEVKNTVRQKKFKCSFCNRIYDKKVTKCDDSDCGLKTISLSLEDSVLSDCEYLELQERQEDIKSLSAIPIKLNSIVFGDLVGKFKAGDNVRVTGIMKMQKTVSETILNRIQEEDFTTDVFFERIVEVHNLELLSTTENVVINDPSKYLTERDIAEIHKLRKKYPDDNEFMQILVDSFAPHVYGHENIKQAILLQNVGSIEIAYGDMKTRKRIHILLVGDPGVNKTRLLTAAMKMSINGHMASGKGVSGVGITASVERDQKGMSRVRVGKAVLANNGHFSLDELGEVSKEDQGYLLDCMESGTFRVDKSGINVELNADSTYLVATNPDSGKYNRYNSLFDNLTISAQLFSRFHLVFVMPDIVKRDEDEKIALHIMSTFDKSVVRKHPVMQKEETQKTRISNELLFKYLLYAQINNTENITIEKEAMDIFIDFYHQIREPEKSSDITATPRQFVGMLMLAYARCRLMLRNVVSANDAQKTVDLLYDSYKSCGMILHKSGGLNQTAEYSKPLDKINKPLAFTMVVNNLTEEGKFYVPRTDIIDALRYSARWSKEEADQFFDKMYKHGKLMIDAQKNYKLTGD